jgi:hypothetical protein
LLCVVAMNKHMAVHHGEPFSCVIYSRVPGFRGTRVRWMKQMNQVVRYKKIGTGGKSVRGKRGCRMHIELGVWLCSTQGCRVGFLFETKSG